MLSLNSQVDPNIKTGDSFLEFIECSLSRDPSSQSRDVLKSIKNVRDFVDVIENQYKGNILVLSAIFTMDFLTVLGKECASSEKGSDEFIAELEKMNTGIEKFIQTLY